MLLIKFLQSDAWKKIRTWVKENGATVLNGIVKLLELLWEKVLIPILDFFLPRFKKFFDDLLVFLDDPSWSSLGTLIGDNKIALAGMAALLAPGLFLGGLRLAFIGLKIAIGLIPKLMGTIVKAFKAAPALLRAFSKAATADLFAPFKKNGSIGRAFRTMKVFFKKTLPNKIKGITDLVKNISPKKDLGKVFKGIGKGFKVLGGIFRTVFLPLGLIIGIVTGIYDGIMAGYKKFQETGSIVDALIAGVTTFIGTFVGAIPDMIKSALSWILEKIGSIFGIESFKDASKFLDSFSISDLITDGLGKVLTMITDFFKSLPEMIESALRAVSGGGFIADKIFGEKTEDELVTENVEKENDQKAKERRQRVQMDAERVWRESGGKVGIVEAMEQAEKLEGQSAAAPARQKRIDNLLASEGEAGLDKRLTHMRSQIEKGQGNFEMLTSLIKSYEDKKAELEAARAGGGATVTNIAQNNSTNMKSSTTRSENISVLDPETTQVQAVNI